MLCWTKGPCPTRTSGLSRVKVIFRDDLGTRKASDKGPIHKGFHECQVQACAKGRQFGKRQDIKRALLER